MNIGALVVLCGVDSRQQMSKTVVGSVEHSVEEVVGEELEWRRSSNLKPRRGAEGVRASET